MTSPLITTTPEEVFHPKVESTVIVSPVVKAGTTVLFKTVFWGTSKSEFNDCGLITKLYNTSPSSESTV